MFSKKKKFFKKKLKEIDYAIWDLEFKIKKSRQIREGVRLDRDRAIENLQHVESALKRDVSKEDKEKMEKERDTIKDNVSRYESQMKMIDSEIDGGEPTEYSPSGVGILERIKSLYELKEMYKEYIKSL